MVEGAAPAKAMLPSTRAILIRHLPSTSGCGFLLAMLTSQCPNPLMMDDTALFNQQHVTSSLADRSRACF